MPEDFQPHFRLSQLLLEPLELPALKATPKHFAVVDAHLVVDTHQLQPFGCVFHHGEMKNIHHHLPAKVVYMKNLRILSMIFRIHQPVWVVVVYIFLPPITTTCITCLGRIRCLNFCFVCRRPWCVFLFMF